MLQVLRPGICHEQVALWEEFLLGYGFHDTEVDTYFNEKSVKSTELFQKEHGLNVDGWVGGQTWGKALELGLDVLEDDYEDKDGPNWPPPPDLKPLVGTAWRQAAWGRFSYIPAPTSGNPEGIKITDDWVTNNVTTIKVPQIDQLPGMMYGGKRQGGGPSKVTIHRLIKDSFLALWEAWEDAGLLELVITWAGMWNPRFIRGSRTSLSNHAFATAFDINAPFNGLRRVPALVGQRGSVRELIPIANELGYYWGGHFSRRDAMHFEATEKAIG